MSEPSRIITPESLARQAAGGMRRQMPMSMPPENLPPDPDEVMRQFDESLTIALGRDLGAQASVVTYSAIRDGLVAAGLPKDVVSLVLPKIKVGVSEAFVKHPRYNSIIAKFTQIMVNLYNALVTRFGEDAPRMMVTMVEDRFALVMPI